MVYEGWYKNSKRVAIKSLKPPKGVQMVTDNLEKSKFLAEGRLLQKYNHKNIVKFIGIAIDSDPVKIVMEYIDGGSLHKYLKENFDISTKQILKFSEECAAGMKYLEENRVVHR